MDRDFKDWFVAERGRALAVVFLTRREDLEVRESKEENGLDYTAYSKSGARIGKRPFGVSVAATMTPVTPDVAAKQLKRAVARVHSVGPFQFPVCVFYFTVKDDQGYYTWAYAPVVTGQGQPRLEAQAQVPCHPLGDDSLEEIISAVDRWYDAFYATITSSVTIGSQELHEDLSFAALADKFDEDGDPPAEGKKRRRAGQA